MISPEERLARYIFSSSHFSKDRVKHGAFMPQPGTTKVSVYRVDGLNETEIRDIGKELEVKRGISLKARANLNAYQVSENNVELEINEPPPRHANILFPDDESLHLEIARDLAAKAGKPDIEI